MTDNNKTSSYQLINGVFSADDARNLLLTLINDKIQFHQKESWSRKERFGDMPASGRSRIDELMQTKTDLAALIEAVNASGERLSISCSIDITRLPEQ